VSRCIPHIPGEEIYLELLMTHIAKRLSKRQQTIETTRTQFCLARLNFRTRLLPGSAHGPEMNQATRQSALFIEQLKERSVIVSFGRSDLERLSIKLFV